MFGFSFGTILMLAVVSVMLFGKRLPEVMRTAGKHFADFKKNLRSIEDAISSTTAEVDRAAYRTRSSYDTEDREEATAPRFEPPPAAEPKLGPDASSAS